MEDKNLQNQIDSINAKLDIILEEIEYQKRKRIEFEIFKEDFTRIGKDLYQTAINELDGVHDYVSTDEMIHLLKKVLRDVTVITRTFEQIENVQDFIQDASPLFRDAVLDLMKKLDELDRKGYFSFLRELIKIGDKIVTSFNIDDVRNLGDNIVAILNTVKNITQPEILVVLNNVIEVFKSLDKEIPGEVTYFTLLKELNKPETKKGLAFSISFLKSLTELSSSGVKSNK